MTGHYGETHMGLHIGNFYRPATFDCMDKVGQRIRAMRKALGWNQEDLASRLGVDQSTVSDIERGAGFSADLLMRMADTLGGSAALIMRGQDNAAWPFPQIAIERFLALDAQQRAFAEGALSNAISLVEPPNADDARRFAASRVIGVKPKQKKRAA